jgi:hypothetical protein
LDVSADALGGSLAGQFQLVQSTADPEQAESSRLAAWLGHEIIGAGDCLVGLPEFNPDIFSVMGDSDCHLPLIHVPEKSRPATGEAASAGLGSFAELFFFVLEPACPKHESVEAENAIKQVETNCKTSRLLRKGLFMAI